MTLTRKQQGFTIVELLIVIIVIGILATLVLVTFTGIQQSARNTQRTTDIKAVASHLETYNAKNGYYPTLANMNDDAFITSLNGLDKESTKDPNGDTYDFASTATATQYAYVPTPSGCDNDPAVGGLCTGFSLTWKEEGTAADQTVNNL